MPREVPRPALATTTFDGREPTLVFLHGLGGTRRYWSAVTATLPTLGHRAILVDLLGFGDSPKPWFRYTVDRHIDALHACLGALGEICIVGHSMGAALALHYTARHPQQVRGLCLISVPHYGGLDNAARWLRRNPGGWIYTNMAATALACVLTRRVAGRLLPRLVRDVPAVVAQDLVKHHMLSSTTSLWEVLYRNDLAIAAAAVASTLPVSFIHGSIDTTAPIDSARALASTRPAWEFFTLLGVDHHPWLREPSQCAEVIARWMGALARTCPEHPRGTQPGLDAGQSAREVSR